MRHRINPVTYRSLHLDPDECTEECGLELHLTIELCKLNDNTVDEDSLTDCIWSQFTSDDVNL